MTRSCSMALLVSAALAVATTAYAQSGPTVTTVKSASGDFYGDAKGMALYTFDKDSAGKSACNGGCATKWPPLAAPADAKAAGEFAPIKRDDGSMQWAMGGEPLYLYAGDTKPGEVTGDGVGGVWHLAK